MIRKEEVYKIGIFNKPHGVQGELSFTFTDAIFDRAGCDCLICLLEGIFVPFFIKEYRLRSETRAFVKLDGINTAEKARMFTNVAVYFPVKFADEAGEPEHISWNYFVGFRIKDRKQGELGAIVEVDDSTANTLFVIDHGGKELLIPAQEEFIVETDKKKKLMTVDLPEGLANL